MQALEDLGYARTAAQLEAESGLRLHEDSATRLHTAILDGDWPSADALLDSLPLPPPALLRARLALRRERYLELLDAQHADAALAYLRSAIAPLPAPRPALQDLTCLLLAKSPSDLRRRAAWPGPTRPARQALWEDVRRLLPPSVIVPARRLETLLQQALRHQEERYAPRPGRRIARSSDGVLSVLPVPAGRGPWAVAVGRRKGRRHRT
jgi:WD repeat-containing protein 26